MADFLNEDPAVIAKEITLAVIPKSGMPADTTPKNIGDRFGKIYKVILKHIREAIVEEKYD